MFNVGVGRVVIHEDENAALLHPFGYLLRIPGLHVMRSGILYRNIGRDDDVVLRVLQLVLRSEQYRVHRE